MNRIVKVARLYLITPISFALVPLLVLAGAFAITLAIFAAIPGDSVRVGGGSQAPMWSLLAIAAIALSHHFPFSQAMSISRREYFAGTMLYATGISLVLALTYLIGGAIESATGGWGFDAYFFSMPWLWDQGVPVTGIFFLVVFLLFFVTGFTSAALYKRFGTLYLTLILIGLAALLAVGLFIIGRLNAWMQVFAWLVGLSALSVTGVLVLVTAALAAAAYLMLRHMVV